MAYSPSILSIHRPDQPPAAPTPAEAPAPKLFGRFTAVQLEAMTPDRFASEQAAHEQRVEQLEARVREREAAGDYAGYLAARKALLAEHGTE